MKKVNGKALSIFLTLLITLPLVTVALPVALNPSLVEAASSASITLDISEGYVGDYITVTGRGFTANKDVTFMWGDKLFSSLGFIISSSSYQRPSIPGSGSAQVHTDALGNFIVMLQVPKLTRGAYTIKADDTENTATATFTIKPKMMIRNQYAYKKHGTSASTSDNPSSKYYIDFFLAEGFVGDWLSLQLSGFGDGEIVEVKMNTTKLDQWTVSTGTSKGYLFSATAKKIPEMPSGTYTVTATGKISGITASATFKVKPELFLASPPPSPTLSGFNWVQAHPTNFGLSWYSSVNATANSVFFFEATGLSGQSIQKVSVVYSGGTSIECQVTGTLTITDGSTQGINSTTVPFTGSTPFTDGLSPKAKIPSAVASGKMLDITIETSGVGGASFTFTKQLFSSGAGSKFTDGTPVWVEGDSTITSGGTNLSGKVDDYNKLVATGLNGTSTPYRPAIVYMANSTVNKIDLEVLSGETISSLTYVKYYDANGNGKWESTDPVYRDSNNPDWGNVTIGDQRLTLQTIGGIEYLPYSTVAAGNPDLGRTLTAFPSETRPSSGTISLDATFYYLDNYGAGTVSEGDTRISQVLYRDWDWFNFLGWTTPSADANGFVAWTLQLPSIPGANQTYNVGLWNFAQWVHILNKVQMQMQTSLEITSAPTSYQSTWYATEGSDDIWVSGKGFYGNEALTISIGGKYKKTVTPDAYGAFSTEIDDMPALPGGEQAITATGVLTANNKGSTTITYKPILRVSYSSPAYNLNPVTAIMVEGRGFEAGTYQIVFDGAGVGEAVTSSFTVLSTDDQAGQINTAFNVPDCVEGTHIVDVVKTSTPTQSAWYKAGYLTWAGAARTNAPFPTDAEFPTVLVWPSLQRTPTSTTVGMSASVTGKGLQPSTTYHVWYDPRGTSTSQANLMATTPATVTTDAKGTLTFSFEVPKSRGGTHSIWVSTADTFITNDPIKGSPVLTSISITPSMTLSLYSGTVGTSVTVLFSGLSTGSQYQLWWYKPEEAPISEWGMGWGSSVPQVPQTALPLAVATGDLYGNSTKEVSFRVPSTAENGNVYCVDLSTYGDRLSMLPSPQFFTVGKVASTITLSLTPTMVTQGERVSINGVIEPAMSVNITLFITDPDGTSTNKTVTAASSGTFTDTFKPDKAGTWQVVAKWDGDTTYAAFTSLAATVTVKPLDMSWAYALTGLGIGAIALIVGLIVTFYYFIRKRREAAATA